jgi:hypothetical protein
MEEKDYKYVQFTKKIQTLEKLEQAMISGNISR